MKTDSNQKKLINKSDQELKNSAKRFKKSKQTIQIRITKDAHALLKYYAWNHDKTIVTAASDIFERIFERGDEAQFIYDFL